MAPQQPFLYEQEKYGNIMYDGFPFTPFDPKAVTRASFQAKRPRPKPDGPLVNMINRHPDAHEAPKQRSIYWKPMSGRTKWWIKATRVIQMGLRVLELIAAVGVLVLFILMNKIEDLTAWVMRITAGVVMLSSVYAIYHLFRPAGGRTSGSSAAYHSFAAITDLVILPLYAFGALAVRNQGPEWGSVLSDAAALEYLRPATYYTLIGSGGAHLLSLSISLWLALMFRRIHKMPPDMNPLESHLTARASHKRNKSSVATTSTYADSIEKSLPSHLDGRRRSGAPYEDIQRPPTVPFMHTRQGSETSLRSSVRTRDSRTDLPSRQYQIMPGNSPRHSGASELSINSKRTSGGGQTSPTKLTSYRNSYAEVPTHDSTGNSRPTTGTRPGTTSTYRTSYTSQVGPPTPPRHSTPTTPREPKFTETWYASESLVNRTQERAARNQALGQLNANMAHKAAKQYSAVEQRYDDDDEESISMYSDAQGGAHPEDVSDEDENDLSSSTRHPNPLRSNPTSSPSSSAASPRPKTPFTSTAALHRNSPLSEIPLNDRRVSGSRDIADQQQLNRKSSIQAEDGFYSKPYGTLKPGTPPVMVAVGSGGRQVSSGNDYEGGKGFAGSRFSVFARRNVSGKVAEEGRGGGRWSKGE